MPDSAPPIVIASFDELKESLGQRPAAIHLGAGVSIALSGQFIGAKGFLGSGLKLALEHKLINEDQFRHHQVGLDSPDLEEQSAARAFIEAKLRPRHKLFATWLRDTVGNNTLKDPSLAGPIAAAVKAGVIVSSNGYDHLLAQTTGLPSVTWRDFRSIDQLLDPPTILHTDGTWDQPDSIVIAVRQDQKASVHREAIQAYLGPLRFLLLVGVGHGFFTSTLCQMIQTRQGTLPGALLCRRVEAEGFARLLAHSLPWFKIVPYDGGYKALPKVLQSLFGSSPLPTPLPADPHASATPTNRQGPPSRPAQTQILVPKPGSAILALAFSRDGEWIVAGQNDRIVSCLHVSGDPNRRVPLQFSSGNRSFSSVAIRPISNEAPVAILGGDQGTLVAIRIPPGQQAELLTPPQSSPNHPIEALSFDPAGGDLAVARENGTLEIWTRRREIPLSDLAPSMYRHRLERRLHNSAILAIAHSPDGMLLATGSQYGSIRLWKLPKLEKHAEYKSHENGISSLVFSPDGTTLASAGEDATLVLWDVQTGVPRWQARGHSASLRSVSFHPSGQVVATGGDDRTVGIWSSKEGRQVARLEGHSDRIQCVAFSPDGRWLASGGDDRTIRLEPIDIETLLGRTSSRPPPPIPKALTDLATTPDRLARFLARLASRHPEGIPLLETLEPGSLADSLRPASVLPAPSLVAFADRVLELEKSLEAGTPESFAPPPVWMAWMIHVRHRELERLGQELLALAARSAPSIPEVAAEIAAPATRIKATKTKVVFPP